MENDILEIIQQYKFGHIPEKQALKELLNLFDVSKRNLIKSILEDIEDVYPEYHRECIEDYLDDGC